MIGAAILVGILGLAAFIHFKTKKVRKIAKDVEKQTESMDGMTDKIGDIVDAKMRNCINENEKKKMKQREDEIRKIRADNERIAREKLQRQNEKELERLRNELKKDKQQNATTEPKETNG